MIPADGVTRRGALGRLGALVAGPVFAPGAGAAAAPTREGIASAHPLATEAGLRILAEGGNAADAAVAVAAALAVVEPFASGIGGGGFFLLRRASDVRGVMVDARETAPQRAHTRMYLDGDGFPLPRASLDGALAAAIPGLPAGLAHVARVYGTLPLGQLLAPAIRLASDGFPVDSRLNAIITLAERRLSRDAGIAAIFLPDGRPPVVGERIRQPALAETLARIAADDARGFYRGALASELVRAVRSSGGLWTDADLSGYQVVERVPQSFRYRGSRVTTASLPSAGGVVLAQSLTMLQALPPATPGSPEEAHLVAEVLRRAFQDRARHLGDPAFHAAPLDMLLSRDYLRKRAASVRMDRITASEALTREVAGLPGSDVAPRESGNTTHLSVVDREGNQVAATLTINTLFGAGIVAGSSGIVLNNEMDDFAMPGSLPNAYGLTGGGANRIEPGKRPLSSMSPTLLDTPRGTWVLGTPGGSRIMSMLLLATMDIVHRPGITPQEVVARPRLHHQYRPDRLDIEPGVFSPDWLASLESRGHRIQPAARPWGNMQLVFVDRSSGQTLAANDPRGRIGIAWF
jgi:gamma-glutamyltranspeptidase/glutathione hydrolase